MAQFSDHEIHAAWLASLTPSPEDAAARAPNANVAAWAALSWRIGQRILERYTVHVSAPFVAGSDGDRRILAAYLEQSGVMHYCETSARTVNGIDYHAYIGLAPRGAALSA